MFEEASRMKLRFDTEVGFLSVEDLWDLPLSTVHSTVSLDNIAKGLNRLIKDSAEESFVKPRTVEDKELTLKFDVVKHIIKVKLEEADAAERKLKAKQRREKIMAIIADKEDEELKNKDINELRDLLAEDEVA